MVVSKTIYISMRCRTEIGFEKLGRWIFQNRIKTLIMVFLLTITLCSQIPKMTIDTSAQGMLYESDPIRLAYNDFRDEFGSDETVIIVIKPPEVFDTTFLTKLSSFHHALEKEVPYLKKVNSLINARNTRGENDVLIVEKLFSGWPEKHIDLNRLRKQVMNNPLLINNLISEDGRYTAVIVETKSVISENRKTNESSHYLNEKQSSEIVEAVNRIVDRYQSPNFQIHLSGSPVVEYRFNLATLNDSALCMAIAPLPVLLFPFFLFRRFSGMLLPYLIILPSLLSALGLKAIFQSPFTLVTGGLPPFLIAVGTGDSIHILTIFYRQLDQGKNKEDAIAYALAHSGAAIVMTTLTTAAGLLSFSFAELTTIAHFGFFAAIGVTMALLYTIFLLPALLAVFPLKQKSPVKQQSPWMDRVLRSFAAFSTSHPVKILVVSLFIFSVSTVIMTGIRFSHFPLAWFPDDTRVVTDTLAIDNHLKGTIPLEIVIDTKKEDGICEPKILNAIEDFSRQIEKIDTPEISVGKVFSIIDIIKEINRALHENNNAHYTIPKDRNTIAQELFLFEISESDALDRVVDFEFRKARITIKTSWVDAVVFDNFIKDMENRLTTILHGKANFKFTGAMSLIARTFPATLSSMAKSYVFALFVISVMMIVLVGDIKIGLVSMLPNLLPIVFVMAIIVVCGFSLDINTMMIGSIAIGIVVDDTVHFIYNFRKYLDETGDAGDAVRRTLSGTGRAMLITTLILAACFATNMLSIMGNVVRFGAFNALIILFALIADFILEPALMVLLTRTKGFVYAKNHKLKLRVK